MKTKILAGLLAGGLLTASSSAMACTDENGICMHGGSTSEKSYLADTHAPLGTFASHMHKEGEWMLGYNYMTMRMKGNRDDTENLTPEELAANFRIVPTEMTMDMHMFMAMYAPSDWLTLMAMGNYIENEMNHITYMGGAGTTVRGHFTTRSRGFGDTSLSGLVRLYEDETHHVHVNAGVSLPTGSISKQGQILNPMGMTPIITLPYAMQLGSGTFDLLPGITYTGRGGQWSWGGQYNATVRLGENTKDYTLGDKHKVSVWGAYRWADWVSSSLRVSGEHETKIDGQSPDIAGPVQTADPDNYGGQRVEVGAGINLVAQDGPFAGHRLEFEVTAPVYQNLNGPQMKRDIGVGLSYNFAF